MMSFVPSSPDFSNWGPCTSPETLTVAEWSACSAAYSADQTRQTVTVGLWLLVALATAAFIIRLLV